MSRRGRAAAAVTATSSLLAAGLVAVAPPASATTEADYVRPAAAHAAARGYRVGISVLDTKTGHYYGGGADTGVFASESVVKTMIATRLLVSGQMASPSVASTAWRMITQSDDFAASSLYGRVGGDGLINWVKSYYRVSSLGTPPSRAGWWGNTHITPKGLVQFYAKVKRDARVAPWLFNAMRHITTFGSDGQCQYFGLPSATSGAAVKQGWGNDYHGVTASFNTTGMVDRDRYAVAVLMRGPLSRYGRAISDELTAVARIMLPGRHVYDPARHDPHLSVAVVRTTGSWVYIAGTSYDPDNRVWNTVRVMEGDSVRATTHTNPRYGFAFGYNARNATHRYCVVAVNTGPGNSVSGCYSVTVNGAPFGNLNTVAAPAAGTVHLVGWAADRDRLGRPATVRIDEDGVTVGTYPTDVLRTDANEYWKLSGTHGFDVTLTGRTPGEHTYRVVALNTGWPGPDVELAHSPRTVTVPTG